MICRSLKPFAHKSSTRFCHFHKKQLQMCSLCRVCRGEKDIRPETTTWFTLASHQLTTKKVLKTTTAKKNPFVSSPAEQFHIYFHYVMSQVWEWLVLASDLNCKNSQAPWFCMSMLCVYMLDIPLSLSNTESAVWSQQKHYLWLALSHTQDGKTQTNSLPDLHRG